VHKKRHPQEGLPAGINGGWCRACAAIHTLPVEPIQEECRQLMDHLRRERRLDGLVAGQSVDPRWSTDPLFGAAGGKMFGMLGCRADDGRRVVLRAFSGQFNGSWDIPGWVGPIFATAAFARLVEEPERHIKRLGRALHGLAADDERRLSLRRERRLLSRQLMAQIHALYTLVNFRGQRLPLTQAFVGDRRPPTGTGDCCAPKLLHHAARHGLRPEAMAEFYWGRSTNSGLKKHGCFYLPCGDRCLPILGFQLCGL
jgi:hypothetical protein